MYRKKHFFKHIFCEKENAYFSLEACMIMPIVFCAILFLIFVGFYQYDKCVLQQDVFRMLIRGSQQKFLTNEEVSQKVKEEDIGWYYDKYFLCRWDSKIVEVEYDKLRIAHDAVFQAAGPMIVEWTGCDFWGMCIDFTSVRIHPVETIRNCRRVETMAERKEENERMGIRSIDES